MIPQKKFGNHKNPRIPCDNHENYKNHKIILENQQKIMKIFKFHTRIMQNIKILQF